MACSCFRACRKRPVTDEEQGYIQNSDIEGFIEIPDDTVGKEKSLSDIISKSMEGLNLEEQPREKSNDVKIEIEVEKSHENEGSNKKLEVSKMNRFNACLRKLRIVKHGYDDLAVVVLLAVGLVSDYFSEHNSEEGSVFDYVYFTLAISLIFVVTQTDNFFDNLRVHNGCGVLLGLKLAYETVVLALSWDNANIHDNLKIFYIALILPIFSNYISFGTASVYLLYLSFNLYITKSSIWISALVAIFLWQRVPWERLTSSFKKYVAQALAVTIVTATVVAFLYIRIA